MRPEAARALVATIPLGLRPDLHIHSGVDLDAVERRGFVREMRTVAVTVRHNASDPLTTETKVDELAALLTVARQFGLVLDPDLIVAVEAESPAP